MKKKVIALLLALSTICSVAALGACEGFSSSDSESASDSVSVSDSESSSSSDGSADSSDSSNSGNDSASDSGSDGGDDGCAEHTDGDNNGVCDECQNSVMRELDIFAMNDLHGKVRDGDSHPGVDEFTTYFKQVKAENPNAFLLSSGDMWQGAAASNVTKGRLVNDWMSEVGFVSMTLGNHEYDWGGDYIAANAAEASFPYLAINVYDASTGARVDYCEASVMYETNGVKVGIIGAMGDCYSSISSDKVEGIEFKVGSALTALVKAESVKLREAGADIIVFSLHDDYAEYDEALSDGYVDIVFEGHSHSSYAKTDSKGIWHLQGGGDNAGISRAQISVNIANETYSVTSAKTVKTNEYSNLAKDPIVAEISQKYAEEIATAEKVVGFNDRVREGDEICQTVAQLYLELGEKTWGDKYDIVLGGGFLSTRSPYKVGVGDVIYGDLLDVLPFDNQIVLCSLSGQKLKDQFINSTNSRYYIAYGDYYSGLTINTSQTYYIVTDTYTSLYKYNGCTEVARFDETTFARDLLADYIGEGNWGEKTEMKLTPISEIIQIGAGLASGATTTESYYVKGTVSSVANTTYGNLYINDDNGNSLYLYGLYDMSGARYDAMTKKPVVGDEIIVYGQLLNYQGKTLEIKNATLIEFVDENSGSDSGNTGNGSGSGSGTGSGSGNITTSDPYVNVSETEFYLNYTPASDYMDAYYRTQHGLLSGGTTVPDQAPTIAKNQPRKNGMLVKNTEFWFEDDGKTYVVVDAEGNEAFRVYKDGAYITLEEVAAYVYAFGTFPANHSASKSTKPTASIWGKYLRLNHSKFSGSTSSYPYEPELPNITGCGGTLQYYEMDIGTTGTDCDPSYTAVLYNNGSSITRGAARIVYGKNDLNGNGVYDVGELYLFYTYNHYNDFQEYLNYANGWGEMFGNITGGGTISSKYDYNPTDYVEVYWGTL